MIFTAGLVLCAVAVFARRLKLEGLIDLSKTAKDVVVASFLLGLALMLISASLLVFPVIWRAMP